MNDSWWQVMLGLAIHVPIALGVVFVMGGTLAWRFTHRMPRRLMFVGVCSVLSGFALQLLLGRWAAS